MPQALFLGVPIEQFWHLNPRLMKVYLKAEKLRQKKADEQAWMMGIYVQKAVFVSVGRSLAGKKFKDTYFDKPMLQDMEIEEVSEEIRQEREMQKAIAQMESWSAKCRLDGLPITEGDSTDDE